jgi:hypothetical protein
MLWVTGTWIHLSRLFGKRYRVMHIEMNYDITNYGPVKTKLRPWHNETLTSSVESTKVPSRPYRNNPTRVNPKA